MADLVGAEGLPEAAVSWNVTYTSPQGYRCQLTLRGKDPAAVLTTAADMLQRMHAAGCSPNGGYAGNGHSNGNGAETKPCPIHLGEMLRKHTKDGRSWWSHKLADGTWCRGKANGGAQ